MSRHLILVKHALPVLEPGVPSRAWRLSDEGRARCILLAAHLAAYEPALIATSAEPKATETARIVADYLGTPFEMMEDLHENDRTNLGWLGVEELEATIARFFAAPDRHIIGNETADEAHVRFAAAIADVCVRYPVGDIVIVAHGTVITLFVSRRTGQEPFPFWKRLGLPSFVVLSLPDHTMQTIVDDIAAN